MKKAYLYVAVMGLGILACSCKNDSTSNQADSVATEDIADNAARVVLPDDVNNVLDECADDFIANFIDIQPVFNSNLTKDEKKVKPDWFLDPSKLNELVTKSQKINALAILLCDRPIMEYLGVSTQESDKVIGKLLADLNNPFDFDDVQNMSIGEKIQKNFQICKERGETQYVWNFALAAQNELMFIISRNPQAFLNNISEAEYQKMYRRYADCLKAAAALAPYDQDIAQTLKICMDKDYYIDDALFHTLDDAKVAFVSQKATFEARRNALLQQD